MNEVIKLENLTKDYGMGRGIFDVNLTINQGEMVGFVGTNGSGKTTTLRNIMGFLKPTSGPPVVLGKEAWTHSSEIVKNIGYVPGEIAFPDLPTGIDFLKCQAEFLGLKDMSYANELIERLQLDPRANLKRMSKGMKQKTALVAALMNDSPIIILDQPPTGKKPLMRVTFLDIIKQEHAKGKTILLSSNMFEEMEDTCDKVALINDGYVVDVVDMESGIRHRKDKQFKIEFLSHDDFVRFPKEGYKIIRTQEQYDQYTVDIPSDRTGGLLKTLKNYNVKFVSEIPYTLEKHFRQVLSEKKEAEKNVQ